MSLSLFDQIRLDLRNRIVMAPMTRNHADENGIPPTPVMAEYYQQQASAGLIITESASISPQGVGYPFTSGLYTQSQAQGWRTITEAVHAEDGLIFIQLPHCGQISYPDLQSNGALPVAPSAIRPLGQIYSYAGLKDFVNPRALRLPKISDVISQFENAAKLACMAGFDGSNQHGRLRLLHETLDAVIPIWGTKRIDVRLSLQNSFHSMSDSNPQTHFDDFAKQLASRNLAYLHVLERDMRGKVVPLNSSKMRSHFASVYIANNGHDKTRAKNTIREREAQLIAFGLPFIVNPDLVFRFKNDITLAQPQSKYFYTGKTEEYTNYECAP
jgi:N-ethylmaleimide reductase